MLDNVAVPVENVLGTIGEGHKVAFNILNLGRVKLGTRNSAGIRLALDQSIAYARERRQFGKAIGEFGLVKQKLAEMTVRCFVSEAMVYRTLGDVDRALEAVDPMDTAGALKAIEAYAVECSINKVATSEALAYAVDEAVQVFGGNGYSREFPVERAYRDARITRIYEGTNEINRLIIPTRVLKQGESILAQEVTTEATGSAFALASFGATGTRGAAPGPYSRQETGADGAGDGRGSVWWGGSRAAGGAGHAADVIIECYAIESAVGRAEKIAARASERAVIAVDVARVRERCDGPRGPRRQADRECTRGIQRAHGAPHRGRRPSARGSWRRHGRRRRRIADAAITRTRYPF